MQRLTKASVRAFQEKILTWFAENKRDLPWRVPVGTLSPDGTSLEQRFYRILVSEVMLQQTQVPRVIPKYDAWLARFPTLEALADASVRDVLALWSGLGYNRRALYLKKCAETIMKKVPPNFAKASMGKQVPQADRLDLPRTEKELRELPGIGEYTARAIMCFAFDAQIAVVDTNVRKVILIHFSQSQNAKLKSQKEIQGIAEQLLPVGRASDWNQALMDYASSVLSKERVPMKKQSAFKDSNRYFRGQIVKVLLAKKRMTLERLSVHLKKEKEALRGIVQGMVRDGLVKEEKKDTFVLS